MRGKAEEAKVLKNAGTIGEIRERNFLSECRFKEAAWELGARKLRHGRGEDVSPWPASYPTLIQYGGHCALKSLDNLRCLMNVLENFLQSLRMTCSLLAFCQADCRPIPRLFHLSTILLCDTPITPAEA